MLIKKIYSKGDAFYISFDTKTSYAVATSWEHQNPRIEIYKNSDLKDTLNISYRGPNVQGQPRMELGEKQLIYSTDDKTKITTTKIYNLK